MKQRFSLFIFLILQISFTVSAQDKAPINFDKITAKDFSLEGIAADTSFGAIVLADIGKSSFVANDKEYFSTIFKRQVRIKIISSKGFDIATVKIPLYKSNGSNDKETLESVSASTYNLVDGKIVETKLNKDNIYKEEQDRNHSLRKFTMPGIKEGSVIDISYTIKSDFLFNLQPWKFQGSYPTLWSEYNLNLPQFFNYVFLSTGTHPFHLKDSKEKNQDFNVRIVSETGGYYKKEDVILLNSINTISRWVMKDIPALTEEKFTTSINNYISRIEFQLSGIQFPGGELKDVMGSWATASQELLKNKDFGSAFYEQNDWSSNVLNSLKLEGKEPLDKARLIFAYVQKTITDNGTKGIYLSQPLEQTLTSRKGYVADINLLLTSLLKAANLSAYPVLISTRSNGIPIDEYPIMSQYNYVISKLQIGNSTFFLDASKSFLGFGKLPQYCYNGPAALIDETPSIVHLNANDLTEKKETKIVLLNNKENKNLWSGTFNSTPGYYESYDIREKIQASGKTTFIKTLEDSYSGNFSVNNIILTGLDNNEGSVTSTYNIRLDRENESNLIYLNPMMKEGLQQNYFRSSERNYPVELPYKMDETYFFEIEIPEGYVVDEIPKSAKVSLNETEGSFEYIITKSDNSITLLTRTKINKTVFLSDEYEALRGFFDYIVKKHAEQIVFKKK